MTIIATKKIVLSAFTCILFSLFITPSAQAALTQEFYTWGGGHDAVVSAFQKSALIFSGTGYQGLFATLATASLAALVIRVMLQLMAGGFKGDGNVAFGALIPWLISVSIFMGGVLPKGTLHIYDPVENKYAAVGGIPQIIVLFASVSNMIERVLVEQVTTAGDPVGFQSQAGGKGFLGLYGISKTPLMASDSTLDPSLTRYISDCVLFESGLTAGYVQELRKTTSDLVTSLGKAASPANMTVLYSDAAPGGEGVSCSVAWASIKTRLQAQTALQNNLKAACAEIGFKADTATELADCQTKMSSIVDAQLVPGKTSSDFLRSAYVAQAMDSIMSGDSAGEANANFSILNKASGTMSTVNNWLPTIRAVILAVTVALTPFLALLMLTPMMGKAVKFVAGSFFFLTVSGIVDATLHQFIIDYSNSLYADVRQYNMGLDALRFFPSTTEKVLAMFGMVRASGMVLAGAIASGVIGMGASVGAAIGGKLMGDVTATGAQGEQQMLDPAAKAQARKANQMSVPTETMANQYSFSQRTSMDYAQQMGQMEHMAGGVQAAGGMSGWGKLQHGQGFTQGYRGQGDVALNKAFMAQAEAMGVPRQEAQQMAAATVNHGEGLAELRRLQAQGYSGQQAAYTYWQGKTADHQQGKSVGQQDGFTMYQPTAGQETGRWGQTNATWQNGQMVGLQGNTINVATSDQLKTNYDKAYSQAISESYRSDQSLGESITKSYGNSGTWSQVNAAAQQLYTATSGSVDLSKSINSSVMSSLRDSKAVDERTGQTIDKSAWAQVTAGAGTPSVSPLKASIEGGASWRVTTSDGKSYAVHQSAEQAKSLQTTLGQTYRTTTSDVRSGNFSSTAQKALAQVESIMGNTTAAETASISYARADEFRENQGQSHARSAEMSASLARDFYHYVGEKQFGGGAAGDRQAIKHLEGLAAAGKTSEIDALKTQYFAERNINLQTLGADMPKLKGPDLSKAPDPGALKAKIEDGKGGLKEELSAQPDMKATDPSATVSSQLKTKPGAVNAKEIQEGINKTQNEIFTEGREIKMDGLDLKKDHEKGPIPVAGRAMVDWMSSEPTDMASGDWDTTPAEKIAKGWNNSVPGKITNGLVDAVPQIADGLNALSSSGYTPASPVAAEPKQSAEMDKPQHQQAQQSLQPPVQQAPEQKKAVQTVEQAGGQPVNHGQPLQWLQPSKKQENDVQQLAKAAVTSPVAAEPKQPGTAQVERQRTTRNFPPKGELR